MLQWPVLLADAVRAVAAGTDSASIAARDAALEAQYAALGAALGQNVTT